MEDYKGRRAYRSHLFALAIGVCIGVAACYWIPGPKPVSIKGILELDTATHQDLYLNNAMYIVSPTAPNGRIYLKFRANKELKHASGAIRDNVELTGVMKSHILDSGEPVNEIQVQKFEVAK